ncbi:hypothetical protein [Actinomadura fibrosa]|uniref:Peptidase inhibitor family I36 protein n=1 Tax=Actinomadura fibrosa TaxID=111802 RepID=A0ABW2XI49_9ACTN|nr:hypothetical protein [Actinomadura fibrosa]
MAISTRTVGIGIALAAAFTPLAASAAEASPVSAQRACTYDVCMYTKTNFKGTWKGYNHYRNKCVSYDSAFKIRSLKINSSKGTTFWSKKGCKGTPSMSFRGHVKVKDYKFTARSSR